MKHISLSLLLSIVLSLYLKAQNNEKRAPEDTDTLKEHPKRGWNFGVIPAVAFSTDIGFQYGALVNLFNYGDSKIYPKFYHHLYLEVSRTTKGGAVNKILFDSEHLINGLRFTADLTHQTEQALDFYGFNGAMSNYNSGFTDKNHPDYISRVFYSYERKMTSLLVNVQGNLGIEELQWLGGALFSRIYINPVNINALNKNMDDKNKLPAVDGLYDNYLKWGLINEKEKDGTYSTFSFGLNYDTRDNEGNPNHGVWSSAIVKVSPGAIDQVKTYSELDLTHRQYLPLVNDRLSFAYHLNLHQIISGKSPFCFSPFLGGNNTVRGILRRRVMAEGTMLMNTEFRYKVYKTYWLRQNLYVGVSSFYDSGIITKKSAIDLSLVPPADRLKYFNENATDRVYHSAGVGLHFVMNQNFVISFEYGRSLNKNDGETGFYTNVGYTF